MGGDLKNNCGRTPLPSIHSMFYIVSNNSKYVLCYVCKGKIVSLYYFPLQATKHEKI